MLNLYQQYVLLMCILT